MNRDRPRPSVLIVVPCLDEAAYIRSLLEGLLAAAERLDATIAVLDGGSSDGTPDIVAGMTRQSPRIVLMHNPRRIQSAAVNHAVKTLGRDFDYFIRIDAHGAYPDDYCDCLVEEAVTTGADSVVVSMVTEGFGLLQSAAAAAQNSSLGTGGSGHRHLRSGRWIDHGHHALMRVSAFLSVGGYDESFRQNEDAELDFRLTQAGYMIWLTDRTHMTYFPRSTLGKLYWQYFGYGRGRARNLAKHRVPPRLRQMPPLSIFPCVVAGVGALVHMAGAGPTFWNVALLLPAAAWVLACAAFGVRLAIRSRDLRMSVVSVAAAVMHFAWSLGFWTQLAGFGRRKGKAAS